MEAVAIICNKNDGKLTKRILISFSSNTQANRVDFNEKEAVAIIHEKLMTNRVHLFFVEIAGFDARSLDTPVKSNFFFSTFKKFSFQLISAVCIQHKVGHFCYSL